MKKGELIVKKNLKKVLSLVLALAMVFAMSVTVSADTVSATVVNNLSDHSFAAYAIFMGDYDSSTGVLSNVAWGDGVTSETLLEKLKADTTVILAADETAGTAAVTVANAFASASSADDVASVLATYNNNSVLAEAFVEAAYASKTSTSTAIAANSASVSLATGYYLIVDTTTLSTDLTVDAYNNALLQVVGTTVTIAKKTDAPSVEKKVQEIGYSETDSAYVAEYNDVADYSIGDSIGYELIGTIPSLTYYSYYKYTFTDTLSAGLTADTSTVKVYLADSKSSKTNWIEIPSSNYSVTTATYAGNDSTYTGGTVLTVAFSDIMSLKDSGGNALSLTGYSYIIVEYQAALNSSAVIGLNGNPNEVYLTYSSNPNSTASGDTDDKTEDTPEDKVIVFTYELDVTKVDSSNTSTKLSGAKFKLYRINSSNTTEYALVSDGKITGWTTTETEASTLTSGSDGVFKVAGLEDGTYYLKETEAPTGYNLLSNAIELTIAATTVNNQTWEGTASDALTALTISVDGGTAENGTVSSGVVSATVTNTKGSVLPTTGGIGTTIFYIVGVILVLGAGVLLVTRRRVSR